MKLVADFYTNKETECMINKFRTVTPSIKYPFHLINNCFKHVSVLFTYEWSYTFVHYFTGTTFDPLQKMMAVKLGLVNIL